MTERSWKRTERAIATILGGKRVPIAGRRGADIAHRWLAVEVKHRRALPQWLKRAVAQAKAVATEHQLPVAILHENRERHSSDLVVMALADFTDWFGEAPDG